MSAGRDMETAGKVAGLCVECVGKNCSEIRVRRAAKRGRVIEGLHCR
jgi:hypothetical protein